MPTYLSSSNLVDAFKEIYQDTFIPNRYYTTVITNNIQELDGEVITIPSYEIYNQPVILGSEHGVTFKASNSIWIDEWVNKFEKLEKDYEFCYKEFRYKRKKKCHFPEWF